METVWIIGMFFTMGYIAGNNHINKKEDKISAGDSIILGLAIIIAWPLVLGFSISTNKKNQIYSTKEEKIIENKTNMEK